jgi:hypothetical protein
MRNPGFISRTLGAAAAVLLAVAAVAATEVPMTKLTVVVKTQSGRPVDRASVVVKFVEAGNALRLGKDIQRAFETRTNQDGEAKFPTVPQGKIRIQVIAKGYQTFGEIFDVKQDEKRFEITLNPPQQQYSSHQ